MPERDFHPLELSTLLGRTPRFSRDPVFLRFLGKDEFIAGHRKPAEKLEKLREVSKAHKKSVALSIFDYQNHYPQRNEAMARAYLSGAYTMAEIGLYFRVHYMTVSRAVKKYECS